MSILHIIILGETITVGREDNFSVITESNIEPLAQIKVEKIRSTQIAKAYHSASYEVVDI